MAAAFAVPTACSGDGGGPGGDDVVDPQCGDEWDCELETRQYDYNAALRIAALRLTGDLPTMTEINEISATSDLAIQKQLYEARLADYVGRPTFARQMFYFWRDTFKMGNDTPGAPAAPELDFAPALAAQLTASNGNYMNLFTQASANCPTIDEGTGVFTPGECLPAGPQAGVLGNPGAMKQFFGNFAFRASSGSRRPSTA
jgi:hypothetical protein